MYNYSFIIPHKNTPELLRRCLASIPERGDIQIIVVDDNSDEGKKPTINRKDIELILLDAEHAKGAGRARNVGLEYAKGKWLLFADADDYYTDYLTTFLDKYINDVSTDIVYLNACKFDENGIITPFKTDKLIEKFIIGEKNAEKELRYGLWTPWSRMVKKDIVDTHHLRYDEIPATNDKMFGLECSFYSTSMMVEKNIVYNYFRPSYKSITSLQKNFRMVDALLDVRCRTISLYQKAGYKNIPSFWELLYHTSYVKGLHTIDIFKKYIKILQVSHTNIVVDQYHFFRRKMKHYSNIYESLSRR